MKASLDQLKEWAKRGMVAQEDVDRLINSTPPASSQPQPESRQPSLPCSGASQNKPKRKPKLSAGRENKTELEFRAILQGRGHLRIERERLALRIGPVGKRCSYTPDYTFIDGVSGAFTLCEVKGAYEYEDARVKRMAAAEWCQQNGFAFLFAQKTKHGWNEVYLA